MDVAERKFEALLEAAPDAIVIVNQAGAITIVNRQTEALFGYQRYELLGRPVELLIPERFAGRHGDHRSGYVTTPQTRPMGAGLELVARHRDGHEIPVEISLSPLDTPEGLLVTAIIRDVSGRRLAAAELARTAAELARSNAELQQFAYVASHDLQEPLRMVASYTQLLGRRYRGKLDADADEFIAFAVDGATRMQTLINDLLAYSRVGARGGALAPVALGDVVEVVLQDLQMAMNEATATVTYATLPTVAGDRGQLRQLFQNLIGNALKYRHPDRSPEVLVSARLVDNMWQVTVRDNGIGIAPEYAERVFVIFQRLHTRADYPGTGIGLAICRKIVERHGGRIWVESTPGDGAAFHLTLPPEADGGGT